MESNPEARMQGYIRTAKRREQERQDALQQRRLRGITAARWAATQLKQLGATRVVLFGSLLSPEFHEESDLDLAVWDLPESLYFRALGQLQSIEEFDVDLVEAPSAAPHIAVAIAQGVEL
jgi:predicted nucleotidyltransferase